MGAPARRKAGYEDILELPDHQIGEILDGELVVSPRPRPRHANAATQIIPDIYGYSGPPGDGSEPGGWWILFEPELHLGGDVLVPDIAGWRLERMPDLPADDAFFTLVPDWVCEILSPSTARLDRVFKKPIYAARGVEFLWLVDPASRTLEVLRNSGEFYREIDVFQGDEQVRAAPFEQVRLNLHRWWRTRTTEESQR